MVQPEKLVFTCSNSFDQLTRNHAGIGLTNLKKRLNLIYPGRHRLSVQTTGTVYEASLELTNRLDTHRFFHQDCKMGRKIEMVGRLVNMHEHDDTAEDIIYWLKKSPSDRLHAVTFLTAQSLPGFLNGIKTEVIDAKQVIYPLFERFYKLLNLHKVQYLTIGGYAMAYFGIPRFSDDLDIWINPSQENMSLLSSALIGLGPSLMMDAILQDNPGDGSVKFGTKPMAVDIHFNLPELEFQSAFANRDLVQISDLQIPFISKNDFVVNKLSSSRAQDVTDGKVIQSGKGR